MSGDCPSGVSLTDPSVCGVLNAASTENLQQPQAPEPTPLSNDVLPGNLQTLVGCTPPGCSNVIGYDFDKSTAETTTDVSYIVDTYYTSPQNTAVLLKKRPKTTGTLSSVTTTNGSTTATVNYTVNGTNYSFSYTWPPGQTKTNGSTVDVYYDETTPFNGSFESVSKQPPQMITPPGFSVPDFFAADTTATSVTVNSVDECAKACEILAGCTGFNFRANIDGTSPFCQPFTGSPVRIPNPGIIGYVKDTIPSTQAGSDPPDIDLSNQGAYCSDAPKCNRDISKLINDGITSFSTSDIESCMYCPIRKYNLSGNTVTNEFGTSKQYVSESDAFNGITYNNDGTFAKHITVTPGNFYTFIKKDRNGNIIQSNTFFYSTSSELYKINLDTLFLKQCFPTGDEFTSDIFPPYATVLNNNNQSLVWYIGPAFSQDTGPPRTVSQDKTTTFKPNDYISYGHLVSTDKKYICTSNDIFIDEPPRNVQQYSVEEYSNCTYRIMPATLKTFLKDVRVPVFRKSTGETYWFDSDAIAHRFTGGSSAIQSFGTVNNITAISGSTFTKLVKVGVRIQVGFNYYTYTPNINWQFYVAPNLGLITIDDTNFWSKVTYGSDIPETTGYTLSRSWTGLTCPSGTVMSEDSSFCIPYNCPADKSYLNLKNYECYSVCPTGTFASGTTCKTCSEPGPGQYVSAVCTRTTDTVLSPVASVYCARGTQLVASTPGSSTTLGNNERCDPCTGGTSYYCPGGRSGPVYCTSCFQYSATGTYEVSPCTASNDRVCASCVQGTNYCPGDGKAYTCSTCGTAGIAKMCTLYSDTVCNNICRCTRSGYSPFKTPYNTYVCCPNNTTLWNYEIDWCIVGSQPPYTDVFPEQCS